MKRTIAVLAILSMLITVNTVVAKSNDAKNANKDGALGISNTLQLKHNESAEVEHNKSAKLTAAHKITFIYTSDTAATTTLYALTKDRHVWSISNGSWTDMNRTLPTTTPAIKQWQPSAFLDARGDAWRWSGSLWVNISHP